MIKKFLLICLVFSSTVIAETRVLAFAGSTRRDSYNKKLLAEAAQLARQLGAIVTIVDLKDLPMPFYDADLEQKEGMPINTKRLRKLMKESSAVIISSPQYNCSIPAVLKNALDWASRGKNGQESKEAFKGKKFAIMSASPSKKGGAKGLEHLRAIIKDCGGEVIQNQVSIGYAHQAFNSQGELENPQSKEELAQVIQTLLQ
ncbi:MAG: NAD(P)H-dependent oxidoreductase [Chlamydiae bacterium]|nr:NAD(P)H-dependent oxidoreductase [Chlamydiota bacterium]